jgi:hypothetical protein
MAGFHVREIPLSEVDKQVLTKVEIEFSILPAMLINAATSSSSDISSDILGPKNAAKPMTGSGAVFDLFTEPVRLRALPPGELVSVPGEVGFAAGV